MEYWKTKATISFINTPILQYSGSPSIRGKSWRIHSINGKIV